MANGISIRRFAYTFYTDCSPSRAMDGRIMRHGIISSCQSATTSEIVKRCCSSLVSSAITNTQTFTYLSFLRRAKEQARPIRFENFRIGQSLSTRIESEGRFEFKSNLEASQVPKLTAYLLFNFGPRQRYESYSSFYGCYRIFSSLKLCQSTFC